MKTFKALLSMALLSLLSGCFFLVAPFKASDQFSSVSLDKPVVVGITHVTLGSKSDSNKIFWDSTHRVIESLPDHQGYLGHKVRKRLFVNEAWTMTIWEDEGALDRFVSSEQHRSAMAQGLPAVKAARFLRHTLPRSDAPIDWKTAEKLMSTKGRVLY